MKITEEQFNSLKQLDRIEYKIEEDRIDKSSDYGLMNMTFILLIITSIFAASHQIVKSITGEINYKLFDITNQFFNMSVILFVLSIFVFLFNLINDNIKMNKLHEKYFKVEVKK